MGTRVNEIRFLGFKNTIHEAMHSLENAGDLALVEFQGKCMNICMVCPCGCGDQFMVHTTEYTGGWDVGLKGNLVTLIPSIRIREGCKSHFKINDGKVEWC